MRELSDGTCRPCTTSEVAAVTGNEPPTRSPSVNPTRPLRTPVQPALSPLGQPSLAAAPGPLEQRGDVNGQLQQTVGQPQGAKAQDPDKATATGQQSAKPRSSSDKENGVSYLTFLLQCMNCCFHLHLLWECSPPADDLALHLFVSSQS